MILWYAHLLGMGAGQASAAPTNVSLPAVGAEDAA